MNNLTKSIIALYTFDLKNSNMHPILAILYGVLAWFDTLLIIWVIIKQFIKKIIIT